MKNKKLINLISAICFLILLSVVFFKSSDILELKTSETCYAEFWKDPSDYDVWFMGTNHMLYGIQPMDLWKDYGYKTYNIAAPSSRMPQIYWTFMCALEYSEPEMVVLDTYHVEKDYMHHNSTEKLHTGFDAIPTSITKAKGVLDIYGKDLDLFTEYMTNFYIYHNRWEELKENDFQTIPGPRKGSRMNDLIYDNSAYEMIEENDVCENTDTIGFRYFRKIIEECQARDIELVLCAVPMCKEQDSQRGMNAVTSIAEEYGLPYLNIAYEDNPVDIRFDYSDNEHMNPSGSRKITTYIGDYLSKNYNLTDYRHDPETTQRWDADYTEFENYKILEMKTQKKLDNYMLWLNNPHYNCYIYQNERVVESEDELTNLLLENIANKHEIDYQFATEMLKYDFDEDYAFIIMNEDNSQVIDTALFTNDKLHTVEIK